MDVERNICRLLKPLLPSLPVGKSVKTPQDFDLVLGHLTRFLPAVLVKVYPEWRWEGLDHLSSFEVQRFEDFSIEFVGVSILLEDQSIVPFCLRLQLAPDKEEIGWLELKIGEGQKHSQDRGLALTEVYEYFLNAARRRDASDWRYRVTFGTRHE